MTDLAVLAAGFGVIPLAAILVYAVGERVTSHREATWGLLAGVVGFLGVSHAMSAVLFYHAQFADAVLATALPAVGLVIGAGIAWLLLEGPFIQAAPNRILGAAVLFVGLHSFGDGIVLGAAFQGLILP